MGECLCALLCIYMCVRVSVRACECTYARVQLLWEGGGAGGGGGGRGGRDVNVRVRVISHYRFLSLSARERDCVRVYA